MKLGRGWAAGVGVWVGVGLEAGARRSPWAGAQGQVPCPTAWWHTLIKQAVHRLSNFHLIFSYSFQNKNV